MVNIPYGYCHCGCGSKTTVAPQTMAKYGWTRSEPVSYIRGHNPSLPFAISAQEYQEAWRRESPGVDYGFCWCGCGERTSIAKQSHTKQRLVKNEPLRFLPGHRQRLSRTGQKMEPAEYHRLWTKKRPGIPYGYCWCGCGQKTALSKYSSVNRGHVKGEPRRYAKGHNSNTNPFPFHEVRHLGYKTDCWAWLGHVERSGYGTTTLNGKRAYAHRKYYLEFVGPIAEGLQLDHKCRVRYCVNPDHLEQVTPVENNRRRINSMVSEAQVVEIKALWRSGQYTEVDLAEIYKLRVGFICVLVG